MTDYNGTGKAGVYYQSRPAEHSRITQQLTAGCTENCAHVPDHVGTRPGLRFDKSCGCRVVYCDMTKDWHVRGSSCVDANAAGVG